MFVNSLDKWCLENAIDTRREFYIDICVYIRGDCTDQDIRWMHRFMLRITIESRNEKKTHKRHSLHSSTYDLWPYWKISADHQFRPDTTILLYPAAISFRIPELLSLKNIRDFRNKSPVHNCITFRIHSPSSLSSIWIRPFVPSMTLCVGFNQRTLVLLYALQLTMCESLT